MSYADNVVWYLDNSIIKVRKYENGVVSKMGVNSNVRYYYYGYKGDFVPSATNDVSDITMTESPAEIPESFHDALVFGVLERLYSKNPETIQVAEYWANKFKQRVIEAKQFKNIRSDGGKMNIQGDQF